MPLRPSPAAIAWCAMLLALTLAWCVYLPGLRGPFLFDDLAHLPALGATGPVNTTNSALRYLTSGQGDPTGRPLPTASFLIDAHDWPAAPYPFKRTNVLLHMLNGLLLFVACLQLGKALGWASRRRCVAAFVGAAAWLLHPFFVSTVLYVIQRDAMLPVTFTLFAVLAYLRARQLAEMARPVSATCWLVFGIGTCTLLAMLSKANGILIPLLVLVVHAVLPLMDDAQHAAFRRRCLLVLGPLAIAVPAYLVWLGLTSIGDGPLPIRGWSIAQRAITEPSILWSYASQLWLVTTTSSSLLHDDVVAATSLVSPWYTVVALAGWAIAAAAAWWSRHKAPAISLAILFFLAGHLMESTTLPLELYFDHRNYVPALFLFWPLGEAISRFRSRTVTLVAASGVAGLLASLTYANTVTWGDNLALAQSWASSHPASARAQAYAAQVEAANDRLGQADATIEAAAARFTGEPQIALTRIDIHCRKGALGPHDASYATAALATAQREPGPLLVNWMSAALSRAGDACHGLDRQVLEALLNGASANPRVMAIPGRRQDILHLRGALALHEHEPRVALDWFNQALALSPTPATALAQAAGLGDAGYPELGIKHLDYFTTLPIAPPRPWSDGMPWLHDQVLARQRYWDLELTHLRASLVRADAIK